MGLFPLSVFFSAAALSISQTEISLISLKRKLLLFPVWAHWWSSALSW